MDQFLINSGKVLAGLFLLKQVVEHGEYLCGQAAERLWSAVEVATGRRLSGRSVGRSAAGKAKRWAGYAALTVADPFIEIARSFVPEPVAAEAGPEPTVKTGPSEDDYRAAVAKFGVSPTCPQSVAAKKWAALRGSGDAAREQEIDAAWGVICAYRGFRMN